MDAKFENDCEKQAEQNEYQRRVHSSTGNRAENRMIGGLTDKQVAEKITLMQREAEWWKSRSTDGWKTRDAGTWAFMMGWGIEKAIEILLGE